MGFAASGLCKDLASELVVVGRMGLHIKKEMRGGRGKAYTGWSPMHWCEVSLQLCKLACIFACVTREGKGVCMHEGTCAHVQYLNAGEGLHVCARE